jgi:endonuclease/exonuclease/phosphatase family metal-dependent hydrolase
LLCASSNAYILFAACATHTAIDSPTSEGPKDAQLDQFLYLSTASYSVGKAIGGDLNDTVDESHLDGYYNGYWEADQSNRTNPQNTVGGSNPKKIDYVFADKSHFLSTRSLVVLTSNPASDHYYLKAYFNI